MKARKSLTISIGAALCVGLCACGGGGSSQSASMPPPSMPPPPATTSYDVNGLARLVGSSSEATDPVTVDDNAATVTPTDDETADATPLY